MDLSFAFEFASEIEEYSSDPDAFARRLGADTLFQEHDSRHYLRQAENKSEPDFEHPEYRQHFDGFEPQCCILDVLFQFGPESFKITDKLKGNIEC